ncbi:ABC transporter ATP-binding protein [Streptomyces sp. L2]|uniref:ABC transporter ATP-binding protein n=1 Tax=Streptomyces sp. L2 TaxID=2162665 RepID=UPI0013E97B8B|nr:ABC transporter ATP-binding protein [Streptomyces sp. L2]
MEPPNRQTTLPPDDRRDTGARTASATGARRSPDGPLSWGTGSGTSAPEVLGVTDVARSFRTRRRTVDALNGVSLSVAAGELVGLLGLNGAGKTTLLKIVSTLLLPSSGSVRVCGHDVVREPRAARRRLSVVLGGDRGLYLRLSARDNLEFFAMLTGLHRRELARRTEQALEFVHLAHVAKTPVETFSRGMRQRLHLAIGMVTRPDLLLLDEPTVGLDPVEAQNVRAAVAAMRAEGTAIVLTSHYLHDIEQLAERVVVLHQGRVLHDLPLPRLLERARTAAVVTIGGRGTAPRRPADSTGGLIRVERLEQHDTGWTMVLQLASWTPSSLRELADAWPDQQILDVRVAPSGLEQVFFDLADGTRAEAS